MSFDSVDPDLLFRKIGRQSVIIDVLNEEVSARDDYIKHQEQQLKEMAEQLAETDSSEDGEDSEEAEAETLTPPPEEE